MKVQAKKNEGGKYAHIDFKPPEGVAKAAKRGLDLRKANGGQGGTAVGVARARDLSRRANMSPETVRRMKAFFDRHQKNRKASGDKSLSEDKGYIAWMLWGGDAGYSWAKKVVKQMDAAGKKSSAGAEAHHPPSYMTIINLGQIHRDAFELRQLIDQHDELEGWVEDKVSQAKLHLQEVKNYLESPESSEPHEDLLMAAKEPWKEGNPPGGGKLTEEWKAKAKARAKKAGRKYPNQVDNMWAMQQQNKASARVIAALENAARLLSEMI